MGAPQLPPPPPKKPYWRTLPGALVLAGGVLVVVAGLSVAALKYRRFTVRRAQAAARPVAKAPPPIKHFRIDLGSTVKVDSTVSIGFTHIETLAQGNYSSGREIDKRVKDAKRILGGILAHSNMDGDPAFLLDMTQPAWEYFMFTSKPKVRDAILRTPFAHLKVRNDSVTLVDASWVAGDTIRVSKANPVIALRIDSIGHGTGKRDWVAISVRVGAAAVEQVQLAGPPEGPRARRPTPVPVRKK